MAHDSQPTSLALQPPPSPLHNDPNILGFLRRYGTLPNVRGSAAGWMTSVVEDAHENVRSAAYDEFQRVSLRYIHLLFVTDDAFSSFKMVHHRIYQYRHPIQITVWLTNSSHPTLVTFYLWSRLSSRTDIQKHPLLRLPMSSIRSREYSQTIRHLILLDLGKGGGVVLAQCTSNNTFDGCGEHIFPLRFFCSPEEFLVGRDIE